MFRRFVALLVLSVSFFTVIGCASTQRGSQGSTPLIDGISVVMLSEQDIRKEFGPNLDQNPFVAPNGTLFPKNWDFIIAKLTVTNSAAEEIELYNPQVVAPDNVVKAWFYGRDTFGKYIALQSQNDQVGQKRVNIVNWWLVPSDTFQIKPGKHEYLLTFMGKHPVPSDLTAQIMIGVNGQAQDFELPVPPQAN